MNTIAATTNRIPRVALVGIIALAVAFALLMIARSGVVGGSDSDAQSVTTPPKVVVIPKSTSTAPTRPELVLLPGVPPTVADALRASKVAVVSVYVGQAHADRRWVAEARKGARTAGAAFVAVNVGSDSKAASMASFAGPISAPSMLVVRRPGKIVTLISGPVESTVVAQAARNAGARP